MDKLSRFFNVMAEFVKRCLSSGKNHVCGSAALFLSSAAILLLSCSLLFYHRCKSRDWIWRDEAFCAFYGLAGNMCSGVGAFLSEQSDLLILMPSFLGFLDLVYFFSISCSIYLWHRSRTGQRLRVLSRRRRQNIFAVSLLFVISGGLYKNYPVGLNPTSTTSTSRRLFSIFPNEHIGNLGYILGFLSFAISWTGRLPFILKANRGEQSSVVLMWSRLLLSGAGLLYGSAIVFHDPDLRSAIKAMPWILSAFCCAVLDLLIVVLVCFRSRRGQTSVRPLASDTESLLGDCSGEDVQICKKQRRRPSSRPFSPKGSDMGLYMDVNVQPMRKVCLKEVTVSREGSSESLPLKRTLRVVRVEEQFSTGSSFIDSELEWDFEEAETQWSPVQDDAGDPQKRVCFPLQSPQVCPDSSVRPGSEHHHSLR